MARQMGTYYSDRNAEGYRDTTFYQACGKWAGNVLRLTTDDIMELNKDGHIVEWINGHWVVDGIDD